MVEQHLNESKRMIAELAEKILLNKDDLEASNRMFGALKQKNENLQLTDYLIDLANERIENLKAYISTKEDIEVYKNTLIAFLQDVVRKKM